jgi:hypothetical protein
LQISRGRKSEYLQLGLNTVWSKYNTDFVDITAHQSLTLCAYDWRPRRSATPYMEWNQILWKGNFNFSGLFVGHNSQLFRLVWGCLIIKKNAAICTINSGVENFAMQTYSNEISYPSINRALRFFLNHFVVHSGLSCIAIPINRMMTLTLWKSENLFKEVVLV